MSPRISDTLYTFKSPAVILQSLPFTLSEALQPRHNNIAHSSMKTASVIVVSLLVLFSINCCNASHLKSMLSLPSVGNTKNDIPVLYGETSEAERGFFKTLFRVKRDDGNTTSPAPGPSVNTTDVAVTNSTEKPKNYTFVEHTSFVDGLNGWDIQGEWAKYDLSKQPDGFMSIPLPYVGNAKQRSVEEGGETGEATGSGGIGQETANMNENNSETGLSKEETGTGNTEGESGGTDNGATENNNETSTRGDDVPEDERNNNVLIHFVSEFSGQLLKGFPAMTDGQLTLVYYTSDAHIHFTVSVDHHDGGHHEIFSSADTDSGDAESEGTGAEPAEDDRGWKRLTIEFNTNQTHATTFTLNLTVNSKENTSNSSGSSNNTEGSATPRPLLAIHHIVVAGLYVLNPTTTALPAVVSTPPSNSTSKPFVAPGSLEDIEDIASAIWTALYVFLALFLLCLVALAVVVARGHFR